MTVANYINHIALVLDASSSMSSLSDVVPKVADNFIKHEAQRSLQLDQETRVTVYQFADKVECLVYDKDVLRLPSISKLYRVHGMTALIAATMQSLDDLALTPTKYGDHSFVQYILTDGQENASIRLGRAFTPSNVLDRLTNLPDNWTSAVFVPHQMGVREAKSFGFPKENISVWDTTETGLEDVGRKMREATDTFMDLRQTGLRGTKSLFTLDASSLQAGVKQGLLQELTPGQFRLFTVSPIFGTDKAGWPQIAPFVEQQMNRPYRLGEAYYELVKREEIQPQKQIAVYDHKAHTVYTGRNARELIGLGGVPQTVKVDPISHPDYVIFVQSTSVNRKLVPGSRVLILS